MKHFIFSFLSYFLQQKKLQNMFPTAQRPVTMGKTKIIILSYKNKT
ncbi:hypothetical protein CLOHYLEM_06991 [[Clostridium] hylemonae DSM 15053]|uniref:Uncharacterized protein n=1 Tax=[Clostridium] hylemonae DSM 15053 TaxID=553973 RepID=C0C4H6_9FIRM|nr:hypothetical protein CLOHYLEM_06991 [[Clostridium] hylemonae DSM 15053]